MNLKRFSDNQRSLACWLALHHTPGVGPITFARLVSQFGEPEAVFVAPNQAEIFQNVPVVRFNQPKLGKG
ncbi:MAG: hypothetical protein Q9N32_05165 [Gammaproteobacteria bacterium]|nr:hypothetical protein [Gammaproteobacteria bacterium]